MKAVFHREEFMAAKSPVQRRPRRHLPPAEKRRIVELTLVGKRLLRAVLCSRRRPLTMMESAWRFVVRIHGSTKSTRNLTVWPMATG
jgi:hypothetical protein